MKQCLQIRYIERGRFFTSFSYWLAYVATVHLFCCDEILLHIGTITRVRLEERVRVFGSPRQSLERVSFRGGAGPKRQFHYVGA